MKMNENKKTLEEKLIDICGYDMTQEIRIMLAGHFQVKDLVINIGSVKLKSDNTTEKTEVSVGNEILSNVSEILWQIKGGKTGHLFLTFV